MKITQILAWVAPNGMPQTVIEPFDFSDGGIVTVDITGITITAASGLNEKEAMAVAAAILAAVKISRGEAVTVKEITA